MDKDMPMKRRDNVIGLIDPKNYSVRCVIPDDNTYCCSECGGNVTRVHYQKTMLIDNQGMVWCTTCFYRCLDKTVRSMRKDRFDSEPKLVHKGGRYYQRLIRGISPLVNL